MSDIFNSRWPPALATEWLAGWLFAAQAMSAPSAPFALPPGAGRRVVAARDYLTELVVDDRIEPVPETARPAALAAARRRTGHV